MKKYGILKITMFNLIWILVGILLLIAVWIVDKNNIDGAGPVMMKISIFYVLIDIISFVINSNNLLDNLCFIILILISFRFNF